jgi:hypothetical protein
MVSRRVIRAVTPPKTSELSFEQLGVGRTERHVFMPLGEAAIPLH